MNDFLNGSKPRRVSDFAIKIFFEIVNSQKERNQKGMISGKPFSFSNLSNFWKSRNHVTKT